jgi:2-(1,2-epoxy-1,2-dihydrophenyl)acetyl-CoA isomerase
MSTLETLLKSYKNGVLALTLSHPKVNAINRDMVASLRGAFSEAEANPSIRCVLLMSSGKIFSAGQDLTDFDPSGEAPYRRHLLRTFNPLIIQMRRLEKPVVAAINGLVSGAALGVVLACDLRIASDQARFSTGFSRIGLVPDAGVSLLLPALIGLGRATEMAFSSVPISAEQALDWGLVNRLVPEAELFERATGWAEELAQGPVCAFGLAKRELNKAVLGHMEEILDYESHIQEIAGRGAEHHEGVIAFLEKRAPDFPDTKIKD